MPQSLTYRLGLLIGVAILATGAFTLAVHDTVTTVQIHGPLYVQIVDSKDLVVDTLPPPLYIVESYLATLELLVVPPSQRPALIERFQHLQREFALKETEWQTRLPPGQLRDKLINASGLWARRFYEQWNRDLLPATERGDTGTMASLVSGPLTSHFEQHRREILELVALAEIQRRRTEQSATSVLQERTYLLGIFGLGLLGTIFIVGWLINRQISEPLMLELRDSEERTRSIVDHALDAVVVMDDRGRIIDWNPQAEQIFGWTRKAILGHKLSETIVPQTYREAHEHGLKHYLVTGKGAAIGTRLEITALRRDGTEFPIELAITPLRLTTGTTFSGFIRDISDRKRAETELRHAKETAEAATVAKSQFLANMSHEIRTPMNGVLGMAELLLTTDLTPKQQSLAQTVHRSGSALLDIINDILDFSKIEANKLELEQIEFSLGNTFEEAVELLAEPAARKHLELTCLISPEIPDQVRGDPVRLRQILVNLISNAIKFTSQGEVAVAVTPLSKTPTAIVLKCTVSDTGIGIAPAARERLFEAFAQADGSTTRRFGGTGLGLAIVKQLVHLMGGEVGVASSSAGGSTFWFTVTLGTGPEPSSPRSESHDLSGTHILVVDDHPTNREILDVHLRRWGAMVTITDSGASALTLLRAAVQQGTPIQVALVDIRMPGMDGLALADVITKDPTLRLTTLIALSSVDRLPEDTEAHTKLFHTWLRKPIRQSLLKNCLTHICTGLSRSAPPEEAQGEHQAVPLRAHILLTEDNPTNREVTLGMVDVLGCTVTMADNGCDALEAASQTAFDLILMDCQMPEMDGFTATTAIRRQETDAADGRHVPIIALTANAMEGDRARCLAAGMDDYLAKPFTLSQLRAVLTQWLPPGQTAATDAEQPTALEATPATPPSNAPTPPVAADVDKTAWAEIQALQRPGRPDILARVLAGYLEDSRQLVEQIRSAVHAHDPVTLHQAAHRLKSSSAQLGAVATAAHCHDLETLGRLAQLERAEGLLTQLTRAHAAACAVMTKELQAHEGR
ncbi:MAG: response regulator [Nitrospira sp.]|nr:response regulator [Nitrospira sp.]